MFSSESGAEAIRRFLKEEIRKISIQTAWRETSPPSLPSRFKLKLLWGEWEREKIELMSSFGAAGLLRT